MLCEGHLDVEVEVKSTSSGAPTGGPAATPPTKRSGGGVVVAAVGVRHCVGSFGVVSRRVEFVSC